MDFDDAFDIFDQPEITTSTSLQLLNKRSLPLTQPSAVKKQKTIQITDDHSQSVDKHFNFTQQELVQSDQQQITVSHQVLDFTMLIFF
jgi:hypothetical protein